MSTEGFSQIILDKYGDDDLLSLLVRYGLFIGAIFQFACMAFAVLMKGNGNPGNPARRFYRVPKMEKKKRR